MLVLRVDLANPLGQALILERAGRRPAALPRVKPGPRDAEHPAQLADRALGLLRRDEREHHLRVSLAKKAAAFFKISRSSVSTRTSRRSRLSSSRSALVSPSARPSSMSSWLAQLRIDCG